MKKTFLTLTMMVIVPILGLSQTTSKSRPTLDSIDLVSTSSSTGNGATIYVPFETYRTLGPMVQLSRDLENDYRETVVEKKRVVPSAEYLDWVSRKLMVLYRSMLIMKELGTSDELCDMLTKDHDMIADAGRVIGLMRLGEKTLYKKEVDALIQKFGVPSSETRLDGSSISDRELLIAAMLRKLNSDFARVQVAH
jgi:hypothetical protein